MFIEMSNSAFRMRIMYHELFHKDPPRRDLCELYLKLDKKQSPILVGLCDIYWMPWLFIGVSLCQLLHFFDYFNQVCV